jgi:hypothetical protein
MSSTIFIAKHYDLRGCVVVPSRALAFYACMLKPNITNPLCLQLSGGKIASISIQPLDCYLASAFAKFVYVGEVLVVSPRERFIYYMNTLINKFQLVDLYLNTNYNLIYDNGIFKIYSVIKQ